MTIKPINRTIGGTIICSFTPWYYIVDQKIIQNSQMVKKKLNLNINRAFLFHNSGTKIFPDMLFSQKS